jgi:hypothetical protein
MHLIIPCRKLFQVKLYCDCAIKTFHQRMSSKFIRQIPIYDPTNSALSYYDYKP